MNEFKKYDLFYLNGLYWELQYINHEITLVNKYESVKVIQFNNSYLRQYCFEIRKLTSFETNIL